MSFDSEVFANLASDWFGLHSNRLILLFDLDSFAFWLGGCVNGREGDVNINRGGKGIGCHGSLAKNKRQIGRDKIRMQGYNGLGIVASGHIEIGERKRVGNCFWIFEVYGGIGMHLNGAVLMIVVQYNR